jgi:hypothetical protein
MKSLLLVPLLGLVFIASSCRTVTPLDPMTMRQSCKCLPENFTQSGSCPCTARVSGTK